VIMELCLNCKPENDSGYELRAGACRVCVCSPKHHFHSFVSTACASSAAVAVAAAPLSTHLQLSVHVGLPPSVDVSGLTPDQQQQQLAQQVDVVRQVFR
jgi:hypothetical protein